MLKVHLVHILLRAVGRLPLTVIQRLGHLLGNVLYYSGSRMAGITRDNISHAYPQCSGPQRDQLIRASLQETGKMMLESAFAWTAPIERCNASITAVVGKEWVDQEINAGKGIIFVMPHLGNWEMINHFLGRQYGLTHMYQPNRSGQVNALVQSCRSRTGTRFVEATNQGLRQQLRALAGAGCIGVMPDQEPDVHTGEFVPFFGELCLTNTLLPRIANRSGAVCVMAHCVRLPDGGGFRVVLEPMQDSADDPFTAAGMNQAIEQVVRRTPAQYLWSYKRFRTRPAGAPERYQFRDPAPIVVTMKLLIWLALAVTALMPLPVARTAGGLLGRVAQGLPNRYARHARQNLRLCNLEDADRLAQKCLVESGKALAEAGFAWLASDSVFDEHCASVEGLEHLPQERPLPLIVLTPPLGNREVVMRFLGARYRVTEYYHPNSSTAVDDHIRRVRTRMGVALVPHTRAGVDYLKARLAESQVVTLCPDQQPRLRGGVFVPFFGQPALTTTALDELAKSGEARIVFAAAVREPHGFRIHFSPCSKPDGAAQKTLLTAINEQLEQIVRTHPEQYRWSDKRFNIRPRGAERVYRR